MRRFLYLLLLLLAAGSYGCQPDASRRPDKTEEQPHCSVPEWRDQLQLSDRPDVRTAACSSDGKVLLVLTDQGAELLQNDGGRLRKVGTLQSEPPILACALSADGNWAATANANSLTVYATSDGSAKSSVRFLQSVTQAELQISRDGMGVACLRSGWLHLYHGPDLSLRWSSQLPENQTNASLLMSANGLTLAVWGEQLTVFAPDGASPLWSVPISGSSRTCVVSDDGVYLALETERDDGATHQIEVYHRWTSLPAWEFPMSAASASLRFSPDGTWLALAADQFYLFRCALAKPVIQFQQSGTAALANGQVLLIEQQSLYLLNTAEQNLVSFQLPAQLQGELAYICSESEWLFALNAQGMLFLVELPLVSSATDL